MPTQGRLSQPGALLWHGTPATATDLHSTCCCRRWRTVLRRQMCHHDAHAPHTAPAPCRRHARCRQYTHGRSWLPAVVARLSHAAPTK
eukprot:4566294-Alexandrium_andersonii.AAC.1